MRRSWAEISGRRLKQNLENIRRRLPPQTDLMAVVKANAYGHGVDLVAPLLWEQGVKSFAVATLEEAVQLRRLLPEAAILVLFGCLQGEEEAFRRHDLSAGLFDFRRPPPPDLKVHLEIDTGMTRLGIPWSKAQSFLRSHQLNITAVYSHFASADSDPGFTLLQIKRFMETTRDLPYPRHICNSSALALPAAHLDAARIGLALYGISPIPEIEDLLPVLCWKTAVIAVNEVAAGRAVGYGGTFRTQRRSLIGVLSTGYADGYSRLLSNRGRVRIGGHYAPVVGNVNMDLISVDLTSVPFAQVGSEAVLLEAHSASPISAQGLAQTLGTIPYEVLTSIGPRVERVLVDGN